MLKGEATVPDKWLNRHVTPWISGSFGPAVGAILARPFLWGAFNPGVCERVFPALQRRTVGQFLRLERSISDSNPVEKVTVIASKGRLFVPCLCCSNVVCVVQMSSMSFSLSFLFPSFIQLVGKSVSMSWLLHRKMKALAQMQKLWSVLRQGTVSSVDKQ